MKRKWYRNPFVWLTTGLGCLLLLPALPVLVVMVAWGYRDIPRSGEHLPKAVEYSPHATNYSYHTRLLHQVCEFDIPEDAFLEMCQAKQWWHPVAIETLAELPKDETQDEYPVINEERKVPLGNRRYVWDKPEHDNCRFFYGNHGECKVDPSGKTDASCFRSVSQGYYYEIRGSNGGGIKVLYDSENGRCYIHSNSW